MPSGRVSECLCSTTYWRRGARRRPPWSWLKIGGTVAGIAFVIELVGLRGREKLAGRDVAAFVRYE